MKFKKTSVVIGIISVVMILGAFFMVLTSRQSDMPSSTNKTIIQKVYKSNDGWSIDYPSSWDKVEKDYIQETKTGKTFQFTSRKITKKDLEKDINNQITRCLKVIEAENTMKDNLSIQKEGNLFIYSYSINSQIENWITLLKYTIIYDGEKAYEFHSQLPPLTQEDYSKIISSFKIENNNFGKGIIERDISLTKNIESIYAHISDFLTKGYSGYYKINSIDSKYIKCLVQDSKIEAIVQTNMKNSYYKKEQGKSYDSNFTFKVAANIVNNQIDKNSIELLLEQDAAEGVIYVPAESILPNTKEVKLYFSNSEYVISGNDRIKNFLVEKRLVNTDNVIENVIKELIKGPKDKKKMSNPFTEGVILKDVTVKGKTAYVNFASGEIEKGGSFSEMQVIGSILNTLGQFSSIDNVQFMLDGKIAETLQGHADTSKPLKIIRN